MRTFECSTVKVSNIVVFKVPNCWNILCCYMCKEFKVFSDVNFMSKVYQKDFRYIVFSDQTAIPTSMFELTLIA